MARTVTRATLRTRIRQRADVENDAHISDAEVNDLINEKWAFVYDLFVEAAPPDYYLSSQTVSVVAGTITYALPSDFYKTRAVYEDRGSGRRRELPRLGAGMRESFEAPGGSVTLLHLYIPAAGTLANDAANIDGVNGWEELLVLAAAIDILDKQERDFSALERKYARLEAHVRASASTRDVGNPPVIKRVARGGDPYNADSVTHYAVVGSNLEVYRPSLEYFA